MTNKFRMYPAQYLESQYKSSFRPSSDHTSSALWLPVHENAPNWPICPPDWNWQSVPLEHLYANVRYLQAYRIAPSKFGLPPDFLGILVSYRNSPSCVLPYQCHHILPNPPDALLLQGLNCFESYEMPLRTPSFYSSVCFR